MMKLPKSQCCLRESLSRAPHLHAASLVEGKIHPKNESFIFSPHVQSPAEQPRIKENKTPAVEIDFSLRKKILMNYYLTSAKTNKDRGVKGAVPPKLSHYLFHPRADGKSGEDLLPAKHFLELFTDILLLHVSL